jgi:hypothetical protein
MHKYAQIALEIQIINILMESVEYVKNSVAVSVAKLDIARSAKSRNVMNAIQQSNTVKFVKN